jgi:hypothetical protein
LCNPARTSNWEESRAIEIWQVCGDSNNTHVVGNGVPIAAERLVIGLKKIHIVQ